MSGVPLAVPSGALKRMRSGSVRAENREIAPTTLTRSSFKRGTFQTGGGGGLSERDLAVLASLARVRLLCAKQVQRLHFTEGSPLTQARRCRRTLARLHEMKLLHRYQRTVGGIHGGSTGHLYGLTGRAQRILGVSGPAGGVRRRRPWEPAKSFLAHVLAVSELFVRLVEAEREELLELERFDAEPRCWRSFTDHRLAAQILKPDALVVCSSGAYQHHSFVEVDLGTEGSATLRRKVKTYLAYAATGGEQRNGGVFPLVAFLVPDAARRTFVEATIAQEPTWSRLGVVGLLDHAVELLSGGRP